MTMMTNTQTENETKEVWKEISGYPNYEVSTFGRVRSLLRTITDVKGREVEIGGRVLKQGTTSRGYLNTCIRNDFGSLTRNVHRLVMETFKAQDKYPIINHIDEDKTNNHIDNLQWCTYSQNLRHNGVNIRRSKRVYQYDKDTLNIINVFRTTNEAKEAIEGVSTSGISLCCGGKIKTHAGYIWSYSDMYQDALKEAIQALGNESAKDLQKIIYQITERISA